MKQVCRLSLTVTSVMLAFVLALPPVASSHLLEKVDNFIVFVDQSGSMAYAKAPAGQQKFDKALDAVNRLDQALPELGYKGAAALFAPYRVLTNATQYKKGSLGAAFAGVKPPFNHMTPMGDGLASISPVIGTLSGSTALILLTDGVSNEGRSPLAEAKALYDKHAPNVCIHVISYADTPEGKKTVDAIGALSACSVVTSDADMDKFAKDALYDSSHVTHAPAPMAAAAPQPAPVMVAKEVITFNLVFGFDKSDITDEMIPVLQQAKMILQKDAGANFVLSGHTDSSGPEEYNQGLSERRAASVQSWLVNQGVSASRLEAVGYGETQPKYDNSTREGRKLNRRVEIQSK